MRLVELIEKRVDRAVIENEILLLIKILLLRTIDMMKSESIIWTPAYQPINLSTYQPINLYQPSQPYQPYQPLPTPITLSTNLSLSLTSTNLST